MDMFKGGMSTVKFLLRTNAIPYLIVNYVRDFMETLIIRDRNNILCDTYIREDGIIDLRLALIQDEGVDILLRKSTQITIDFDIIKKDLFYEFLELASHAYDIFRNKQLEETNDSEKFTSGDFEALSRLAREFKDNFGN